MDAISTITPFEPPTPGVSEYLPVNRRLHLKEGGFTLIRIDPEKREALLPYDWRATPYGAVSRKFHDTFNSRRLGRRVQANEQLARRLLQIGPGCPWFPRNADWFDLRLSNLCPEHVRCAIPPLRITYDFGSTFRDLPSYREAAEEWERNKQRYVNMLPTGRRPKLPRPQVVELLNAMMSDTLLQTASLSLIRDYLDDRYKILLSCPQISLILAGKSIHVPGFDYAALRKLRPTKSDTAYENWALSREFPA